MKAISIKEPWISMILDGKKTIETRPWFPSYRGYLLLCASKTPESENSGNAVGVAYLYKVATMTQNHVKDACCDVYPNACSLFLKDIRKIKPFLVKGSLGIFDVNLNKKLEMID